MQIIENPFLRISEAPDYNSARPKHHVVPISIIRNFIGHKLKYSLDVGCGTGLSTKALKKISKKIIGCDSSASMLQEAKRNSTIKFVKANAENLPFKNAEFDLINVTNSFHWFKQNKFLKEANRVLENSGFLCIDIFGFEGTMKRNSKFKKKFMLAEQFVFQDFPHGSYFPSSRQLRKNGFSHIKNFEYQFYVEMSDVEFIRFLMSRSVYLRLNSDQKEVVRKQLNKFYLPLFGNEKKKLLFRGELLICRKLK